ncbi:MAG TPA: ATP-binding protein [Candidatus Limnocylindrales bacterium]|nr:ATP-binding protein [Candidatus Limnocylindrales bacterium]
MSQQRDHVESEPDALAGVARVARALVGAGGLSALSNDAMVEIRDALGLDMAALYLTDQSMPRVLRLVGRWPLPGSTVDVAGTLGLDAGAWRFLAASAGPLVFRERTGWVMASPFEPAVDNWVVMPLVSDKEILGAVVGCSPNPISLSPATVTRFILIGDLLSAGTANAMLRAEIQQTALQRERMQLAQEIHDDLAQDLAAAVRELALLEARPPAEVARASEQRLREAVLDAHRVVRNHLNMLTGRGDEAGLRSGVEAVCSRFRRRGLDVTVTPPLPGEVLDPTRVVLLLRILSESLANVQRHAGVSEATVELTLEDGTLTLSVADRGAGFDASAAAGPATGHHGLAIMRERANAGGGALSVRSQPGMGTTIELSLPTLAPAT